MAIEKSDSLNTKIIKIVNSDGTPVEGLSEIVFIDDNDYIELKLPAARTLLLATPNIPVFLNDVDGTFSHLHSHTYPTRTDALNDTSTYPTLFQGYVISKSVEDLTKGYYKISYDFNSGPVRRIRLFTEDPDSATNEVYEEDEFRGVIVIDYDELEYMHQVNKAFRIDPTGNKLYFDFDNGNGLFEIPINKIPNIPNNVNYANVLVNSYLSQDMPTMDNAGVLDTRAKTIQLESNKSLMLDKISNVERASLNMQTMADHSSNDWDFNSHVYVDSLSAPVDFNVSAGSIDVYGDLFDVVENDVIKISSEFFKIIKLMKYDKIEAMKTTYEKYLDNTQPEFAKSVYLYNIGTGVYDLQGGVDRTNVLTQAINYAVTYYGNLFIDSPSPYFVVDRQPSVTNASVNITRLDSPQKNTYNEISLMESKNFIPNIYYVLDNDVSVALNKIKNLNKNSITDLSNIEYSLNDNNKWNMKRIMTIDEINNKLKTKVVWDQASLVDNEKIVSYQVSFFKIKKGSERDFDDYLNKLKYSDYVDNPDMDIVVDFKNTYPSIIRESKLEIINIKQKSLNFKRSDVLVGISGSTSLTVADNIFTEDDTMDKSMGNERHLTIAGVKYFIKSFIAPNNVVLDKQLPSNVTGLSTSIRYKYPTFESNISSDVLSYTMINVDLNDIIMLTIRPISEYDVVGPWSKPMKIIPVNTKYMDSEKYFLNFLEDELKISTDYTQFDSIEPNPPILDNKYITWYDADKYNTSIQKNINDKLSILRQNDIEITKLKLKMDAIQTNALVDLDNDYVNNPDLETPSFLPNIKNVYMDVVRISDVDRKRLNEYSNGTSDGFYHDGGVKKKSLQSMLSENITMQKDIKDLQIPDRFRKYKIALTFKKPSKNQSAQIVRYMLSYKVVSSDGNSRTMSIEDPDDDSKNLNMTDAVLYSPILGVVRIDPFTSKKEYKDDGFIRRFEFEAIPGIVYELKVSAISDNGLQSNWSNMIYYKIDLSDNDINNVDVITTDDIIATQIESSMMGYKNDIEKAKLDLANAMYQINEQLISSNTTMTKVQASVDTLTSTAVTKENMNGLMEDIMQNKVVRENIASEIRKEVAVSVQETGIFKEIASKKLETKFITINNDGTTTP